ncbi:unnamed protein product [Effrenium voratum]|uniref:Uncharacterized protein n=1 Tax=Effrenium voratum TaxID=2562239 RepID=A0AA36N7V8_9DINO|nr:unnamed protein product [Effrenium voratum]CAJ1452065.1 unnamed protein product [Effrenium voratum]
MRTQLKRLQQTMENAIVRTAPQMNAREVSNVIWAVEKRYAQDPDSECPSRLVPVLAGRLPAVISVMEGQSVANVIWAAVKLATSGASQDLLILLPSLVDRAQEVASVMNAQDISNVIWATGQLVADPIHSSASQRLRELLPDVVVRARDVLPVANPQSLANSCWGLALCDYHDEGLLQAVASKVVAEAAAWQPRGAELDLPSVIFAFARLKRTGHDDMLGVAAEKLVPMLLRINDWGLCALTWSYSELDFSNNFLSFRHSLEAEVARRGFSDQDVERSRQGPETWRKHPGHSI